MHYLCFTDFFSLFREGIQREKLTKSQNENKKRKIRTRKGRTMTKCNYCPQFFDMAYIAIHERCHTGEKPFKCTVCSKAFSRQDSVYNHEIIHYEVAKVGEKYICPDSCGYSADSKRLLYRHMRKRHGISELNTGKVISQSSATTEGVGTDNLHSMSPKNVASASQYKTSSNMDKTGNSNAQISTTNVKKAANTPENLVQPKPRGKSQCPYCEKMFKHGYIEAHIRIHTGETPFRCRFCPKAFPRPDYLKEHLRRMHDRPMTEEDSKPHESPSQRVESKTYTEGDVYGNSSHNSRSSNSENDALESVSSAQKIRNASLSYSPRQVPVPAKNATIVSSGAKSAGKRKGPIHQCTYCSKMLPTFRRLQEHMSIHTDQKLYECSLCDKSYRFGFQFYNHRKTAHGNSAACVTRNPIRTLNHISQSSEAQRYSEQGEELVNSTAVTPPMKNSSAETKNMVGLSAETTNAIKKMQTCTLCDVLTGHLKIHLITTHNMTEEKAEKLIAMST